MKPSLQLLLCCCLDGWLLGCCMGVCGKLTPRNNFLDISKELGIARLVLGVATIWGGGKILLLDLSKYKTVSTVERCAQKRKLCKRRALA